MMRRLFLRSYTFDANTPSASGGDPKSGDSSSEKQSHQTPTRHPPWLRSSSQPATWRNSASFNEISDGNWTYCIETQNTAPAVKGFGNVPIVSYDVIEAMGDRKLKVCTVTWNINEKGVKILSHLAQKIAERGQEMDSDIFFISLQEIPSTAPTFHEEALRILEPVLNGHRLYLSHRAWSQMVIVFIRQKHLRYAIQPQVSFIASGAMAKPVRTKGAIAVCLRLYQRFIVLIGCHLSHATPQQRIQDYAKVVRTLRFPQLARFHAHAKDEIFGSDVVLWIGDLNFRVTVESNVDWRDPEKITEKTFRDVFETEELASHRKKQLAFTDFKEAPIKFPPTHKFEPDTDNYVPKRIPSFTDRVLFWVRNSEWLQNIQYDCMRGTTPSDHKAVFATFWLTVINKPVPEHYKQQKSLEREISMKTNSVDASGPVN
ncbi:Inositol polyphosphate-related phosphatase domain-containing protein [Caenorhabditis elegans]|uniref:Inositol polyphosphate-related phosphatase domain-containing protein n=1 Tax=Caenorhabditis elegans TaxID=6239 RepID=N1NTE2_CAEEL|nr:Inositol polyphosphate-related phosphatase domain-containing protein [Caenorhabditis elegans]CCW45977.1 Inositol polyphosphate-related phosphatase domain-containing protein [Caenorhabditis elegans]|eukprot:NP_001294074.1 INositol Polyphosphate-5-Phosphatase [Caenorhabditis elegans]